MHISRVMVCSWFVVLASFALGVQAQVVRTWVSTAAVDNPACSRSSPCRTFGAAVAAVDTGGEVVVLDSGGYGPFTVTKSVTILAPKGIHAAIAPTTGNGITVDTPAAAPVRIANLELTSHGAAYGISSESGAALIIEDCTIRGFGRGVNVGKGRTKIVRSHIIGFDDGTGLAIEGPAASELSFVTVSDSHFTSNWTGISANANSRVMVEDTVITGCRVGALVVTAYSNLALIGCTISFNEQGIYAGGAVRLSGSAVIGNFYGSRIYNGSVLTFGDNVIHGNNYDVYPGNVLTSVPRQ